MYICDSEENSEDVFGIDGAVNWYYVWAMEMWSFCANPDVPTMLTIIRGRSEST